MYSDDDLPFDADAIAGTLAHIAAAKGAAAADAVLAVAEPKLERTDYDNLDGGTYFLTLFLAVPTQLYAQLFSRREDVEKVLLPMLKPLIDSHPGYWASGVAIVPSDRPPPNWREMARVRGSRGRRRLGSIRSASIRTIQHISVFFVSGRRESA